MYVQIHAFCFIGKQNAERSKTGGIIGLKEMEAAKESDDEQSEEDIDDDDEWMRIMKPMKTESGCDWQNQSDSFIKHALVFDCTVRILWAILSALDPAYNKFGYTEHLVIRSQISFHQNHCL